MSPERLDRLRVVGLTALVTFLGTLGGVAAVVAVVSRQPPPTPRLAPPKTITVTLYPIPGMDGLRGCLPTEIPAGEFDRLMRLVTPDVYDRHRANDWISPLVAEVVITHEGQQDTRLLVRWTGKNPAATSVDGYHYFYGSPHEDVHDGAIQLVSLVARLAQVMPR